jgi:hypothetical protein
MRGMMAMGMLLCVMGFDGGGSVGKVVQWDGTLRCVGLPRSILMEP